tara:strand:+ start:3014 stop:9199 length:6186 start_codon:yes stop_codon:yes gene_type:complete
MRSRVGINAIARRKLLERVTNKSDSPAVVVPGSNNINTSGIAVPARGIQYNNDGNEPESTNLVGGEIKVDDEGRMDLSEIEKMDPLSAGVRGTVVPTEQMVGIAKDVAYGVASKDQKTMESGLDLVLNPLIKPFMDPRLREEGVIKSDWYFPEELKLNWKVLPEFMQKGGEGKPPETRSFVDGMSGVIGNVGAIIQSPMAHKIAADEFAVSEERFNRSSGTQAYYIGSALGELPYFIIGAGQVKAVGTIAAKATAGIVRGGLKGPTGARVIATAYKIERATEKLAKVSGRANKLKIINKITTKKEVLIAVKLLKDGIAKNSAVQKAAVKDSKSMLDDAELPEMERIRIKSVMDEAGNNDARNTVRSNELDRFGTEAIKKIEDLPEVTPAQKTYKKIKVDRFNAAVQETLLPDMRKFKDGYLAHATSVAKGTKTEKLAQLIEGSPGNISDKIDSFFNRPGQNMGDSLSKTIDEAFKQRLIDDHRAGKYAGVMGNIKFNKDLYGNSIKTALGITRSEAKMNKYAKILSRTVPTLRYVTKSDYLESNKRLVDERKSLELDIKEIKAKGDKKDLPVIAQNQDKIKKINETLDKNKEDKLQSLSYDTKINKEDTLIGPKKDKETRYVYDYQVLADAYPALAEKIIPEKILFGARPSVKIQKKHGIVMGQIGDDIKTSKTFWFSEMPRSMAQEKYLKPNISKNPSWTKKIGLKKIGRYRTLVPRRAEPKETIIHFYEASDDLRPGGGKKSGVSNVVSMSKGATKDEIRLIKKKMGLEDFDGDPSVTQTFGGKDKILLQYKYIPSEQIKNLQEGKPTKSIGGETLNDVLRNRAELEIRPEEMKPYLENNIKALEEQMYSTTSAWNINVKKKQDSNLFKSEANRSKKIDELTDQYNLDMSTLESQIKSKKTQMNMDPIIKRDLNIKLQSQEGANSKGTVISMPWQKVLDEDSLMTSKYESDMIKHNETGKKYYISGDDWYEVIDPKFKPSMVTEYANLKQQKSERVYPQDIQGRSDKGVSGEIYGTKEGRYYSQNVLETETMPSGIGWSDEFSGKADKTPEGAEIPGPTKDNQARWEETNTTSDAWENNTWNDVGGISGRLDDAVVSNRIFLKDDTTYKNMLKKLTPEDKAILESGSTLGKKKAKLKSDIDRINQADPKLKLVDEDTGETIFAKKTKKQLLEENVGIVLGKFQMSKVDSLSGTRSKVRELLVGEKFSFVSRQGLEPDMSTYGQRVESMVGRMAYGDSTRISGYDTPFRRMFGTSQSGEITQPSTGSGIKVTPMYDMTSVAHIIDETVNETLGNYGKGLQANKGTNYEQMLEIAQRQGVEDEFKERMVDLVYTKVLKKSKPKEPMMKQYLETNSPAYQKDIVSQVNDIQNKNLRSLNRKEKKLLKNKNKNKRDKVSVIDPVNDFKDVLDDVSIDTRNPIKRVLDNMRSQTVRSEPEVFGGQREGKAYQTLEVYPSGAVADGLKDGQKIPQPNVFNQLLRAVSSRNPKKQGPSNTITTEQVNPYIYDALKSILNEPMIAGLVDRNKKLSKIRDALNVRGETPGERAMKVQEEITVTDGYWKEGNALGELVSAKPNDVFKSDVPTFLKGEPFIDDAGKKNKLRGASENKVKLSDGESVDVSVYKTTLDETKDTLRASVYITLGVPLDASTSAGRKMLSKDIEKGFTTAFSKQQIKQQSNNYSGDIFKNLEDMLGDSTAVNTLNDPGLQRNIKTFSEQQTVMQKVDDKVAENLSGEPLSRITGYSSSEVKAMVRQGRKKDNTIGFRQQIMSTAPITSDVRNYTLVDRQDSKGDDQGIFGTVTENPFSLSISPPLAYGETPRNIVDQTIGDIQKTMSGVIDGNKNIGESKNGLDVKTYEMAQSLNIFDSSSAGKQGIVPQSQNLNIFSGSSIGQESVTRPLQTTNLLEGLNIGLDDEYGKVMITPKPESVFEVTASQVQRQVTPQAFELAPKPVDKQLLASPKVVTPKVIPQRVTPLTPVFTAYDPRSGSVRNRSKGRKEKKKKTWWQTPENWYEPYYWGGKDQMGAGYVTFTGKEPGKVKKYEKRFFGIGVNDSPFDIRSKWF